MQEGCFECLCKPNTLWVRGKVRKQPRPSSDCRAAMSDCVRWRCCCRRRRRHVAEPYTRRYSQWQLQHLLGKSGTEGTYNQRLYRFGISRAAENPRDLEEAYKPRIQ